MDINAIEGTAEGNEGVPLPSDDKSGPLAIYSSFCFLVYSNVFSYKSAASHNKIERSHLCRWNDA